MERTGTLINKTYRNLLASTLAMTASMYLSSILDGIMVGQLLGTLELSAINLTYCVSFLKNILIAMFTYGGNTLAIMHKGRRDNVKANEIFTLSFFGGIISSVIITGIGLLTVMPVSNLLSQSNDKLQPLVLSYLVPLWAVTPLVAVTTHIASFSRTDGMKKLAAAIPVVSNIINLLCDYLYMGIFKWGIA